MFENGWWRGCTPTSPLDPPLVPIFPIAVSVSAHLSQYSFAPVPICPNKNLRTMLSPFQLFYTSISPLGVATEHVMTQFFTGSS